MADLDEIRSVAVELLPAAWRMTLLVEPDEQRAAELLAASFAGATAVVADRTELGAPLRTALLASLWQHLRADVATGRPTRRPPAALSQLGGLRSARL